MLSPNLEQTLHRALAYANERRHDFATLEHLLLALADDQDAVAVMRACNVDVERLKRDIRIPERLRYLKDPPKPEQFRDFAEKAFAIKRILRVNPRPVTADDCEAIYRDAW